MKERKKVNYKYYVFTNTMISMSRPRTFVFYFCKSLFTSKMVDDKIKKEQKQTWHKRKVD